MDYRTCICPHCGKEVPVPDEMQAFSCIFCGSAQGLSVYRGKNICRECLNMLKNAE